jgi:Zn-dependent protease with chaperone function
MKVLEFIKKNISVFNLTSLILFFYSFYLFIFLKQGEDFYYAVVAIIMFFLFLSLSLFFSDYFLNKKIRNRFFKNILEFIILIIITSIIYKIL